MNFSETAIVDGTLYALGCFSLLTWSVILLKVGELLWHRYRLHQLMPQLNIYDLIHAGEAQTALQGKQLETPVGRMWLVGQHTYQAAQTQSPISCIMRQLGMN